MQRTREHATPRLDPGDRNRRIAPDAPLVAAYLGDRPIVLARPDPRYNQPGEPARRTIPMTLSRLRRAIDIERGYAVEEPFRPSLTETYPLVAEDWPATHVPAVRWGLQGHEEGAFAQKYLFVAVGAALGALFTWTWLRAA